MKKNSKPNTRDVSTEQSTASPVEKGPAADPIFAVYELFAAEVKRLLLEKGLTSQWADELIEGDRHYLVRAFEDKSAPVSAAFEIFITQEESAREPIPQDRRLKLDVSDQVSGYLQQLAKIGLWGDSVEAVGVNLIQQQLVSKLESGLLRTAGGK